MHCEERPTRSFRLVACCKRFPGGCRETLRRLLQLQPLCGLGTMSCTLGSASDGLVRFDEFAEQCRWIRFSVAAYQTMQYRSHSHFLSLHLVQQACDRQLFPHYRVGMNLNGTCPSNGDDACGAEQ